MHKYTKSSFISCTKYLMSRSNFADSLKKSEEVVGDVEAMRRQSELLNQVSFGQKIRNTLSSQLRFFLLSFKMGHIHDDDHRRYEQ